MSKKATKTSGGLVAIIADEDTVTGFLLAGEALGLHASRQWSRGGERSAWGVKAQDAWRASFSFFAAASGHREGGCERVAVLTSYTMAQASATWTASVDPTFWLWIRVRPPRR